MADIREQTTKWLEYVNAQNDEGEKDKYLLALTEENKPPPDSPEAYDYVVKSRRMGAPIWIGRIDHYPYMFYHEIEAAILGEADWNNLVLRNLELQVQYEEEKRQKEGKGPS